MPAGAEILSIQYQAGVPTIWAIIDTDNEKVNRELYVFGTGHDIPETTDPLKYLATIQDPGMGFVWHVFE